MSRHRSCGANLKLIMIPRYFTFLETWSLAGYQGNSEASARVGVQCIAESLNRRRREALYPFKGPLQ